MSPASRSPFQEKGVRYALVALLLLFAVNFLLYTRSTNANVVHLPWFFHAPMIENYFEGELSLADLRRPFAEHGMFGYNLILLLNLEFFRLNTLFDAYFNVLIAVAIAALTAHAYARTFPATRRKWLPVGLFAPIALVLFSVTQGSSGAMETQVRLGTLAFFFISWWADRALLGKTDPRPARSVICAVALIFGLTMLFATFYSFAWLPGLIALGLYAAIVRPERRPLAGAIIVAVILAIPLYFFFHEIKPNLLPSSASPGERLVYLTQSLLGTLSSASLGRTAWETGYIGDRGLLGNGVLVALAYLYACWLWLRRGMPRLTWLPILMMASSVGVGLLVAIGRAAIADWTWGTSYWYLVHTKFGLAGCLWIFAYVLGENSRRAWSSGPATFRLPRFSSFVSLTAVVFLSGSLAFANYVDWQRAPLMRHWFEAKVPYAFARGPLPLDAQGMTPFHAPPGETLEALRIFRKYRLTFFADAPRLGAQSSPDVLSAGEPGRSAILGPGWHQRENAQRWMAGQSAILFRTGPRGVIVVNGFLPGLVAPNTLSLFVNEKEIARQEISEGLFTMSGNTAPETEIELVIRASRAVVPEARGLGSDQRELAAVIKEIKTY